MVALQLTRAGLSVLVIEAGRSYSTKAPRMFEPPTAAPLRANPTPDRVRGFFDGSIGGYSLPGEPYSNASMVRGERLSWYRARVEGGRSNHWGRVSLRCGEYDFKPKTRDGVGRDWPIGYADLEPYYTNTERLIGVFGGDVSYENAPVAPPGVLQRPPPPRAYELAVKKALWDAYKIPVATNHLAILTASSGGRAACFAATSCERGCSIGAAFQSTTSLLPWAAQTGKLTIRTNAQVRHLELDGAGAKVASAVVIDRETGEVSKVTANVFVLAASSFESVRILLNSRSSAHPDGLGNEMGQLGRGIMDTPSLRAWGHIPSWESAPAHNEDGAWQGHMYVPWWGFGDPKAGRPRDPELRRGYLVEFYGGRKAIPERIWLEPMLETAKSKWGPELRAELRRLYGAFVSFAGRAEMLPNPQTYCELDTDGQVDAWGVPVLKFHWKWGESEMRQIEHMRKTFTSWFEALGGSALKGQDEYEPGKMIHEVGGAAMGASEADSVLNREGRLWAAQNVYVADGAAFPTSPHKPPTLTILALAWRVADQVIAASKGTTP